MTTSKRRTNERYCRLLQALYVRVGSNKLAESDDWPLLVEWLIIFSISHSTILSSPTERTIAAHYDICIHSSFSSPVLLLQFRGWTLVWHLTLLGSTPGLSEWGGREKCVCVIIMLQPLNENEIKTWWKINGLVENKMFWIGLVMQITESYPPIKKRILHFVMLSSSSRYISSFSSIK